MKKKPDQKKPPKAAPRDTASARAVALGLVNEVLEHRRTLEEGAKPQAAALNLLEARDRGFAHVIALTTLRRLGQIDAILAQLIERPLSRHASTAQGALRIGVAQIAFLGTPAHAAVDATVALLSANDKHRGLVNAVLRRVAAKCDELVATTHTAKNAPAWLLERWRAAYGEAVASAILAAHQNEPPLDLVIKGSDATAWAAKLNAEMLPTGTLRLHGAGPVEELAGFSDGTWWVQDAAAAMPVRLLGAVAGQSVIDLCAAPGGKTAQLAALGAEVTALDRSKERLARLEANMMRLGLTARVIVADAAKWTPPALADAVLLDAPCSATGTIRRHPDLPWLRQAADIVKLAGVQERLLDAAANMLKPGGLLVYAVCSLEPEEGAAQIDAFLARNAGFAREPVQPGECGIDAALISPAGDLRTLPCHWAERGGMDGFFAARLRRKS